MNIGVIPARLGSSRFPKKILADLNGKPLVVHTVENVMKAKKLDKILLAIDSEETQSALEKYNFDIIMTSKDHVSGTDRVAEVIDRISEARIIINIQADEPLIDPKIIDSLVDSFKDNNVQMSTAVSTRLTVSDLLNPNIVKALIDQDKNAIEFKRNIFDVEIGGDSHTVLAHVSGKMRMHFIKILPGDVVTLEMSPYDLTRARIVYRKK